MSYLKRNWKMDIVTWMKSHFPNVSENNGQKMIKKARRQSSKFIVTQRKVKLATPLAPSKTKLKMIPLLWVKIFQLNSCYLKIGLLNIKIKSCNLAKTLTENFKNFAARISVRLATSPGANSGSNTLWKMRTYNSLTGELWKNSF